MRGRPGLIGGSAWWYSSRWSRMGATMRVFSRWIAVAVVALGCGCAAIARAQAAQAPSGTPGTTADRAAAGARGVPAADNPVADPKAVVTIGYARFTVLTPQLIRIECSANDEFEDHASLVFINRRLPVPKFTKSVSTDGTDTLTIRTDALTLKYTAMPDYKPTPGGSCVFKEELSITLMVDGKQVTWHPGESDPENLMGTTRTLDTARGSKTRSRLDRGWCRAPDGRWWMIRRDRCSTRPIFDFLRARRVRGRG